MTITEGAVTGLSVVLSLTLAGVIVAIYTNSDHLYHEEENVTKY